jgi:hypothetical protein
MQKVVYFSCHAPIVLDINTTVTRAIIEPAFINGVSSLYLILCVEAECKYLNLIL